MKNKKEPFKFSYNVPSLDWYKTIHITINLEDYYYFKLQRRFGPSWWLIGSNPKKDGFDWKETQIGELESISDVKRFIEWAKTEHGSRLTKINAISGDFDIIEEISNLLK